MSVVRGLMALLIVTSAQAAAPDDVFHLGLRYAEGTLYNPMTGRDDKVTLRSYVGADSQTPFVAPVIELAPGQLFRVRLSNDLPTNDPSCATEKRILNEPQCYNTTNLHLHGMWVSPSGNADNVLLSIAPGTSFDYEYAIPPDHPAGTYFYHTHQHGSTALQVSSGMAGAIIVRGDRAPQIGRDGTLRPGDIDIILKAPDGTPFRERIVMLQQIPYACPKDGKPKAGTDGRWLCDGKDVGEVENYDLFGQSTWDRSGRFTGINGEIVPTFTGATAGAIERWRVIHGGVRDSVTIEFRKLTRELGGKRYRAGSAEERRDFVAQNCTGEIVPAFSVALDGQTRQRVVEQKYSAFQPGYRQDLLVAFPEPGIYCIIDDETAAVEATGSKLNDREVLGFVEVGAGPGLDGKTSEGHVQGALIAAANAHLPADVKSTVVAGLEKNMSLAAFVPHADIADAELTGKQTLGLWYFNTKLGENEGDSQHEIGELGRSIDGKLVLKNPLPYAPERIDRTLKLGGADEWTLSSFWGGHPLHIHVNPFQIVSIKDPEGREVSGHGDHQFANLKGEWKDTLFIEQGFIVAVRMRYERYIGDFVLHCHILDHEDKGMMQNVRIVPPGGRHH